MFFGLIVIIIFSVFLSIYFKKNNAETLFTSIAGITFILYIFGLLKMYIIGLGLIVLLAFICLTYIIYYFIKNKDSIRDNINFSLLGFLLLFCLIYYIVKGSKLICLDEFTAWGLFAKDTFYSKELYLYSELPALAKNYQAGTAIFQSFFEILNFNFSEDILFMANNIIYLSLGSFILKNKSKFFQFIVNLLIIFIVPLTMLMWPTIYYSILVDIILGFVFAYIIFYYFNSKTDTFSFLNISLAIFFISCSKLNGILLALVCLTIIYLDLFIFKKQYVVNYIKKKPRIKKIKNNLNFRKTAMLLLPIFILIFTYFSWNIAISLINVQENVSTSVIEVLFAFRTYEFKAWMPDFIETIKKIIVNYKFLILLIISIFIIIFNLFKPNKSDKLRFGLAIILYILSNFAYIFFLFLVCSTMINSFIAVEALRRYLYTLVAADIFLVTYTIIQLSYKINIPSISLLLLAILFSTTDANYQTREFLSKKYTYDSISYRQQFNESVIYLNNIDTKNNIVYIISEKEVTPYILNYELLPGTVSILDNFNEEKIMDKDSYSVYKLNISTKKEQDFLDKKRSGDVYIYVYDFSEEQRNKFSFLFESPIEEHRMYKMIKINEQYRAVYYD